MVVLKIGFGEFDIFNDFCEEGEKGWNKLVCPMCEMHVKPITVSFTHCIYKWKGRKHPDPEYLGEDES